MAEGRDASIKTKFIGQQVLDLRRLNLIQISVMRSFGYNDDRLPLAKFTMLSLVNIMHFATRISSNLGYD
jgi:hypothetical protein